MILITGYATAETGVEAIRAGAFDLLTKPLIDEELELAIDRALSQRKVIEENAKLKAQLDLRFGMENIVGHDHRMLKIFDMIDSVADTRATVLITGESGTGKSLIARAIHRRSSRRDKPFVEVACGALPETLLESELFGHVAGVVHRRHRGQDRQVQAGRRRHDLPGRNQHRQSPSMQVKLLRVLQELEFEPVGGTKTFHVDTRVILATNDDLARAVTAGRFRQDLYYRINVINIELPPLALAIDGYPAAGRTFSDANLRGSGKTGRRLLRRGAGGSAGLSLAGQRSRTAERGRTGRAAGQDPCITLDDLPRDLAIAAPSLPQRSAGRTLKEALAGPERQIILETLQEHNWNRNATAEQLGINRTTLYKKMKRLGLETPLHGWMPAN